MIFFLNLKRTPKQPTYFFDVIAAFMSAYSGTVVDIGNSLS